VLVVGGSDGLIRMFTYDGELVDRLQIGEHISAITGIRRRPGRRRYVRPSCRTRRAAASQGRRGRSSADPR
jgi:hypothetical protein